MPAVVEVLLANDTYARTIAPHAYV